MAEESQEMLRLKSVRDAYAKDVERAERDRTRAETRLEAAKLKLSIANEMIAKVERTDLGGNGATFAGLGKYSNSSISDAMLDAINTHAGVEGVAVKELREILVNEGLSNTHNLGISLHITGDRLKEKNLIEIRKTESGKRFFKVIKPEGPAPEASV